MCACTARRGRAEARLLHDDRRAKFRKPVIPGDTVEYHVRKIRRRANIWKFGAEARVGGAKVAEAEVSAMLVDS
jgi:3-hydroxyacyl-[acyl-carrier-protein] dehydratase